MATLSEPARSCLDPGLYVTLYWNVSGTFWNRFSGYYISIYIVLYFSFYHHNLLPSPSYYYCCYYY